MILAAASIVPDSSCGSSKAVNNNSAQPSSGRMSNQNQRSRQVAKGSWGGLGVVLEVADEITVEFDCAHGVISGPIVLDDAGKFSAKGSFFREHGGPIRQGEDEKGEAVVYSGSSDGKTMNLKIKPEGNEEELGSYQLTLGQSGRLRKCK
jgi:hypothetical protein